MSKHKAKIYVNINDNVTDCNIVFKFQIRLKIRKLYLRLGVAKVILVYLGTILSMDLAIKPLQYFTHFLSKS